MGSRINKEIECFIDLKLRFCYDKKQEIYLQGILQKNKKASIIYSKKIQKILRFKLEIEQKKWIQKY